MKTLIIIDVQNDFMPSGSLPIAHGDSIVPIINNLLDKFDLIVTTQDWHPANHQSFASNHPGKKPFDKIIQGEMEQILWPNHCIQGTFGAEFHPALNTKPVAANFYKGINPKIDSYSGFYDNDHKNSTGLAIYLRENGATELYFCGLCADICVYFSIRDAITEGFNCSLIEDATLPFDPLQYQKIRAELRSFKVSLLNSTNM